MKFTARSAGALVAVVGMLATSLATTLVWQDEQTTLSTDFGAHIDALAADLQDDVKGDLQVLDDLAVADQSVANMGPIEFGAYVDQIMVLHPELLGMFWAPRITDAERATFERPGEVHISQFDEVGQIVPAATRSEYFPLQYGGSPDGSTPAALLGLDLASSPVRARALVQADATNQPAATGPVVLLDGGNTRGVLVVRAVRNLGELDAQTGRPPLRGYVEATFAMDRLVAMTPGITDSAVMQLSVDDVTDESSAPMRLYTSAVVPNGAVLHVSDISVAGRTWEVAGRPTQATILQPSVSLWWFVPLGGLLVTLLAMALLTIGLTRRNARVARARAREELVAMVSHDVRTPAMSLVSGAEILLGQDLSEAERRDVLTTMVTEGRRLNSLLNDFLEANDAGQGRLRVVLRPTDLAAQLVQAATAAGEDPERPVRVHLASDLAWVLADPDRIQQLVGNLLSNARKYSPAGGAIDVIAESVEGMVRVAVVDRGLGIPAEAAQHLFDPYYRVDSDSRRGIRGTGLGLAIVKGIVEAHGGRIGAESAGPGCGSRFWFTLQTSERPIASPLASGAVEWAVAAASGSRGVLDSAVPAAADPPGAALRILVVDDEPSIGSMVRRLVRADGHHVGVALCAEEALERLDQEPFDVVLSDLGLGAGLDGWQLAAAVRRRWPEVRFVLATGSTGITLAAARLRGVDGLLTKPYSPQSLRQLLADLAKQEQRSPIAA